MAKVKSTPSDDGLFSAPRATPKPESESVAPAPPQSDLVEYTPAGETSPWRVEKFLMLTAEFELTRADLPRFHDVVSGLSRPWMICRRLYGIKPVLLPMTANPEDYRTLVAAEVAALLGIAVREVSQELDAVRGAWMRATGSQSHEAKTQIPQEPEKPKAPAGELAFQDEVVLNKYGFPPRIFHWEGRLREEEMMEREWFARRVLDFGRMLDDGVGGPVARQLLLAHLNMRRCELETFTHKPNSALWKAAQSDYEKAARMYNERLEELGTIFPLASIIAQKEVIKTHFAAIIEGFQEYSKKGETRIFDGMMTLMEIQVESRRSVQLPVPQYRMGIAVMVNAARAGLWDPNWKLDYTNGQLKKLDAAWRKAYVEADEAAGVVLPDMTSEDPVKGEFPPVQNLQQENVSTTDTH